MKRIRTTTENRKAADLRTLEDSDYFIPKGYVDKFANEITVKKGPPVRGGEDDRDGSDDEQDDVESVAEGDPTDGVNVPDGTQTAEAQANLDTCVKNWKSASDDDSKRMWAIFDESGVFMSACRHGFILWIIDMIRSGEL